MTLAGSPSTIRENNKAKPVTQSTFKVVIFGAGSIGCYLGGRLLSSGVNVVMVGRKTMQERLRSTPLTVTDYGGFRFHSQLADHQYVTSAEAAGNADLVLVTVKSAATSEAGRQLAPWVADGIPVVSLQNGISNAEHLQAGRPTEIDWINGEVVKLAEKLGTDAPINRKLVQLMHEREKIPKAWGARELLLALMIK
ncbi:MAG: hypothetical protein CMG89_08890 [Marinobacter sp.]|nr:hypothetical protein [Marinobacter sp.]